MTAAAARTASLAALAAAAGLIWATAPAWACAPPAGGGSPSSGGESHPGPDSSGYDNGAAEGAREGVAGAAAGQDNSGEGGPARASPMTATDASGQIGAIAQADAAANAGRCAALRLRLMNEQMTSMMMAGDGYGSYSSDSDPASQSSYDQITAMTPDQLDAAIARARKIGLSAADSKALSFAMDLRASQLLGLEDDVKKKFRQQIAAANQAAAAKAAQDAARQARQQATIRDLQSQIADLGCDTTTASAAPSPVSTDASQ